MIRKNKLHMTLLLCAAVLCVAANGSVVAQYEEPEASAPAGMVETETAGPDAGTGLPEDIETGRDGEEGAARDNYVPLYINGALHSECLVIDGVSRMSLGRFATLAGLSFDGFSIGGLTPQLAGGGEYAVVNGRYFYLPDGLYELGGELLWPLSAVAKMFGCSVSWDAASGSVNLDLTDIEPLESGETYYDEQDVYWLSRIIYAESGNQPLAGQIGVGNVVLNRVESELFPDSVFEVIFDRSCGVQFSPVENGTIYAQPDEEAVAAARLCLEGYNTAGGSLYFVNPDIGAGYWFAANLTFVTSIGDHDFYA